MADEEKKQEQPQEEVKSSGGKKGLSMMKVIIIGLPLFLLQVVAIYFLTAHFIVPQIAPSAVIGYNEESVEIEKEKEDEKNIYLIRDVIINPAETNGTRFLLTTIGFEVGSEQLLEELERKEIHVRDILNTILTSKRLDELVTISKREILRKEIAEGVNEFLNHGDVDRVYFSKFIIQ